MTCTRSALHVFVAVCMAGVAPTQQQQGAGRERIVSVRVVSATEDSVYLDHGRDVGLVVGDRVQLFAPGGGELEVVVRSLTHSSARCEPAPGVQVPPVGTLGEAVVRDEPERSRGGAAERPDTGRDVPAHPPWTRVGESRSDDQPLLVPAYGLRPEQRAMRVHGRLFGFGQYSRDQGGDGATSDYLLLRSGLRADFENAFGAAERTRFAGEWSVRDRSVEGRGSERDETGRVDLASVAFGTGEHAPIGVEIGRFLSPHLPEIGLIDGVEGVLRAQGGVRFGGGVGAYPRPFPARNSGDDVGVHAFVDYTMDDERTFAAALGVQKTWHRGAPDRDLLLLRAEWRPAPRWSVLGNAKVDFYTGSDTVETRDAELTEALLQVRWNGESFGAALVGSHFGWPELKRSEYVLLSDELVRDGGVDRASLSGYWRATDWCTLRARADRFTDRDRDGGSLRGDCELRSLLGAGSALALSVFRSDGSYTSGPGASATLRHQVFGAGWRLGYRWHRYSLDALVTGPEQRVRESVQFGCAWPLGARCDLDVSFERWFGDGEHAFAGGLFVQWRL